MSESKRNIAVGITTLLGIGGMVWMIMIFGELPKWTEKTYFVHVELNDAQGLTSGSRIRLNGVDIGQVEFVVLLPNPADGVTAACRIKQEFKIPKGSVILATTGVFGGAATLNITPPQGPPQGNEATDGSTVLKGEATSITGELQALARKLSASLPEQFENLNRVTTKLVDLGDTYVALGKDIRGLVEQRSPADVDAGKFAGNLSTVLARADQRVAEMKDAVAGINALLGDKQLQADIRATVQNAKEMTASGKQVVADAGQKLDQLTRKAAATADDLAKTMANLDGLITDARAGKGTVGKLLQDPAMYDNFTDAAARLSDAVKELRLLIQKWKSEGLPVQF